MMTSDHNRKSMFMNKLLPIGQIGASRVGHPRLYAREAA
jgi:hypothetical protein